MANAHTLRNKIAKARLQLASAEQQLAWLKQGNTLHFTAYQKRQQRLAIDTMQRMVADAKKWLDKKLTETALWKSY